MTLKTIYIARHGYRSNWLPPPHPPNPTGIDSDPALAPHGVEQAKELAGYLGSLPKDEQPQFILASPFYRCVETSQPIAQALKTPIALERGIGEWYKKSRDVVPEPANYDVLKKFFPELGDAELWNRDETIGVIPNKEGETEEEIYQRSLSFWKKLIPTFEAKFPEIDNIILVTHAASKIALGSSLLGVPSVFDPIDSNNTLLRAGACSLDKYILEGDRWTIKMNGNCDFLTQGEEMNWNFHWKFEAGSDEDIKARKELEKKKKLGSQGASQDGEMPPVTDIAYGLEKPSDDNYEVSS
ncbi:Piso0_000782 [Millerozyma farinosa CBS 7064]|uniref:Piso0_000782 protein n=1 Tax=Pichia sorbitophila (strain ATCC MYA-4447 / BCRC 22081 / CBS 7064 / NBRC 10061 / NRRL Y-12695) TaxID=559304 RepID=G8YRH9_PICSO|nr:Piso0_000782 [Millerozyma farinosa CBS 7064]